MAINLAKMIENVMKKAGGQKDNKQLKIPYKKSFSLL